MLIPEQRLTASIRGDQGYGKSTLAGRLVETLLGSGQFRGARIYIHNRKVEETLPKYPSEVIYSGKRLTMQIIRHFYNQIVIAEDATRLDKYSEKTFRHLASWLARSQGILALEVTQDKKPKYPTHLDVVTRWVNNCFFYRIYEGKVHTDDIDWTICESDVKPNINPLIDAFTNGIEKTLMKTVKGKSGRPSKQTSLYAQCMRLFNEGRKAVEVTKMKGFPSGSKEYHTVFVYHRRWRLSTQRKCSDM